MRAFIVFAILTALPPPAIARAQTPAPAPAAVGQQREAPASEIIVTAPRDREDQVREFVGALMPARNGSIPRFIDEVCPLAVGLVPAQNAAVAARLRKVAAAVQLRPGAAGCAPNAVVVVTSNKRALIEALAKRRPEYFGPLSSAQVRRLARSPGPAAAWQLEGPVDADGIALEFDEALGAYRNDTTAAASRIRAAGRRGFDASVLVVEVGAVDGLSATQLGDYAAMRLFAKLDPARLPAAGPPTILKVVDAAPGTAVPVTMTSWDFGVLRGLYGSAADLSAGSQRSQIAEQVLQELGSRKPE